jgi:parallel beta-helix repeat protein
MTAPTIQTGDTLAEHYVLGDLLQDTDGQQTYLATAQWGSTVHLTVFQPQTGDQALLGRQRRSALTLIRQLAQVQHPGVARVQDLGEHLGVPFMVQDPLQGQPLGLLASPALAAHGLFGALGALHAQAVLQGRLTGQHLWQHDEVYQIGPPALGTQVLRASGSVVQPGDPRYSAPEVQAGAPFSAQSDLYALAAVLLERLSGAVMPPVSARLGGVPLPALRPEVPAAVSRAISAALALAPGERAVNTGEVLEMLSRPVAGSELVAGAEPVPGAVPEPEQALVPASVSPILSGAAQPPAAKPPSTGRRAAPVWPLLAGATVVVLLVLAGALRGLGQPDGAAQSTGTAQADTQAAGEQAVTPPGEPAADEPVPPAVPERPVLRTVMTPQIQPLQSGPSLGAGALMTLPSNSLLDVYAEQDGWLQVRYQGQDGWIEAATVRALKSAAEVAALISQLQAGQPVTLEPGIYRLTQPLVLENGGTLVGAGLDQTLLIGTSPADTVVLRGGRLSLSDLTVAHGTDEAARVVYLEAGTLSAERVRLTGARRDTAVNEYGSGLWVAGSASATLTDSVLDDNAYGLYVSDSAVAEVTGSVLSLNREGGALFRDSSSGSLTGNTIERNGAHGVHVLDMASPTIADNQIRQNAQRGVSIYGQAQPTVSGNTIERNGFQGIGVQDQAAPELSGNTVQSNAQSGVTYFGTAAGTAHDNTIARNRRAGIAITKSASPTLSDNTVSQNGENGLAYSETGGGTAQNNIIERNTNPGIAAWGTAHPTLTGNTVRQNAQTGVVIADQASAVLSGNTLENNVLYGLIVTGTASVQLDGNTVGSNQKGGVFIKKQATASGTGNTCTGNGGQDISVEEGAAQDPYGLYDALCSSY